MGKFSFASIAASAAGVLAAYDIGLEIVDNPLCKEGSTPWTRSYEDATCAVYEPLDYRGDELVVFLTGGAWRSGTIGDDWFVGTSFMGRAVASHSTSPCRIALVDYPKCVMPRLTIAKFYAGLAVFALAIARLLSWVFLPLQFWLVLASICYAAVGWLVWVREIKTSGSGKCSICGTAQPVNVDHQLEHIEHTIKALVDKYKPRRLVISGHSAGGHLAATLGVGARTLFPSVERIFVIGISGVYNVAGLWHQAASSPIGWFVTQWCLTPCFFCPVGTESNAAVRERLSPIKILENAALEPADRFHLVSARYDNEMLYEQAEQFAAALGRRGVTSIRHRNVGLGHGLGLAKSAQLIDLLLAIAVRDPLIMKLN